MGKAIIEPEEHEYIIVLPKKKKHRRCKYATKSKKANKEYL